MVVGREGGRGRTRAEGWRGALLCAALGLMAVLLFAAEPCEATTKPYRVRDSVAVVANNVSRVSI